MTPADLSLTVLHAVRRAVDDGALRVDVPPRVKVERARPGGAGEYASNIALTLARPSGRSALDVAGILRERLRDVPGLRCVEITGPGFLNFTLRRDAAGELVRAVRDAGAAYGSGTALAGTTVRFADPKDTTGPRAALVTRTVVRLLRSQGADAGFGGTERIHVREGAYDSGALDGLGSDAAHWALLRAAPQDRPLDGPPLLVQHERNALFRVRYAHSRVRRLLVNGAQLGVVPSYGDDDAPALLGTALPAAEDPVLLGALRDHPPVLLAAARHRAPDRVARHLETIADALLAFQHGVLPLGDEKPSAAHRSRLALAEAAGTVLAGGLSVLGISAPDRI
ncbi:DALR anticodon-binding domain-containing protein [Streptomyces sp. SR27]|uniref:ArgS-related anticodon-binding protein NrtL n=1 Tax=Streptomyces sp. SR27 TaxID=3076630 RepID=UPI00295B26C3|nr:DALR anticodon-binding domain-containing protein [Streptomyces sp. SR27]MDV9188064.1 DALR anticodon-binding domain-containing protein [Streptomyces sp. SR27]